MKIGIGVSAERDPASGAARAAAQASRGLEGAQADLVLVFASGDHLRDPEPLLAAVRAELTPAALAGCGAGGVLGDGRELESGTAVAVWAASLDRGVARVLHVRSDPDGDSFTVHGGPDRLADGLPALPAGATLVLLSDPYTFRTDSLLDRLAAQAPGVPVLGGLSSGRTAEGSAALFQGDEVVADGAIAVVLDGVETLPCVSQGAAPVGPEMTITAAEGNVIHELAGRPALSAIEHAIAHLPVDERALVAGGLLIGIVIDAGRPEYEQGDFLVRGVLGADPRTGSVAVGTPVAEGEIVRLHARDARSADEDLRRALRLRAQALGNEPPAGALVFSCNGRGRGMFGVPDHDADAVAGELLGAPAAGFFAAGEIGPVGGRSFLHGFTATVAVFPA
ncbi:MAG: FIST signal transduction protein [Solirubrobacteraceae bacterium]